MPQALSFFAQLLVLSHVFLMKGTERVCSCTGHHLLPWATALQHCWGCATEWPSLVRDAGSPHSCTCRQALFPESCMLHEFVVAHVWVAFLCRRCRVLPAGYHRGKECGAVTNQPWLRITFFLLSGRRFKLMWVRRSHSLRSFPNIHIYMCMYQHNCGCAACPCMGEAGIAPGCPFLWNPGAPEVREPPFLSSLP